MTSVETRILVRMLRQQDLVPEDDLRQILMEVRGQTSLLQELVTRGYVDQAWADEAQVHVRRKSRRHYEDEVSLVKGDRSLGQIALSRGWLHVSAIETAVLEQQRLRRVNLRFRIGEILVRTGALSADQVREILAEQGVAVHNCVECHDVVNVDTSAPGSPRCPSCQGTLIPAQFLDVVKADAEFA